MKEIWKDINGYEGLYQISNMGNVKSLERFVHRCDGVVQHRKERIMCKRESSDGYYMAKFNVDNTSKSIGIHRLVAQAFLPNQNKLNEVNHKDCNRKNNCVDNLEWCTHKDNVRYSIQQGNHISTKNLLGENNPNYRNHKLHEIYVNNKALALKNLSRKGGQNGRAVAVNLYSRNYNYIKRFDCISDCANYLLKEKAINFKVKTIKSKIGKAIKNKSLYLNYYYEKA